MFVRVKKSGPYQYLQVVHNQRRNGRVHQHVIATLGRLDPLRDSGQLDGLLQSVARFSTHAAVLGAFGRQQLAVVQTLRLGPVLVFERLWQQLGFPQLLARLLQGRRFEFPLERAIFLTVLHRLFAPGSDRAAEQWCRRYALAGIDDLQLQHLYRAMAWLGEPLAEAEQAGATPFTPRCQKDRVEEALFAARRDLFTGLELVFFDTTSLYFEGEGGEQLGQYGYSKDHRPDWKQLVVGAVLDEQGRPICCELWPGNTTDVTTLIPIVDRLRQRFGIERVCVVADRGMISRSTKQQLAGRRLQYILGARLRNVAEVRAEVLSRAGRYHQVQGPRPTSKAPAPLRVKEVRVEGRRYVVCHNDEQARKDQADREAIVAKLREQLQQGPKALVGNKGFRKYLRSERDAWVLDEAKIDAEARFDGKWVLETNTALTPADVALKYKELMLVEQVFRSFKSILVTRPIWHKCDETIRGHVFCSFLALVLLKELLGRLAARGWPVEWARLRDDLDALAEVTVQAQGKTFVLRTNLDGDAGKALQAAGVALGPAVRRVESA